LGWLWLVAGGSQIAEILVAKSRAGKSSFNGTELEVAHFRFAPGRGKV
jgi:hypothetical protein